MPTPNGYNPVHGGVVTSNADGVVSSTATTLLALGSSNFVISAGVGAPSHAATKGSLYIRVDGSSTSTRMYMNTNGSTTWANFTSAA